MKQTRFHPHLLPRAEALALNLLFQGPASRTVVLADHPYDLTLLPRPRPCPVQLEVVLRLDEAPVLIGLERDIFTDALAPFLVPGEGRDLPAEIRLALLEAVCEEALEGLAQGLGQTLGQAATLDAVQESAGGVFAGYPCLGFALTRQSDGWRVLGTLGVADQDQAALVLDLLAGIFQTRQPDQAMNAPLKFPLHLPLDIPFDLPLIIGRSRISVAELRGLEVNDLVLIREFFPRDQPLLLLGPGQAARLAMHGSRATITAFTHIPLEEDMTTPAQTHADSASAMPEEDTPSARDVALNLDALTIELRFELGRQTLTLGELHALTAGRTFELDMPVQAPVTVTANARPVARGELLDIEGRIGVRVLELLPAPRGEGDVREPA